MHQRRNDKTISFRLRGRPLTELLRQSEALGVSPGALGRAIALRYLERDDTRAILEAIEGQSHRIEALAQGIEACQSRRCPAEEAGAASARGGDMTGEYVARSSAHEEAMGMGRKREAKTVGFRLGGKPLVELERQAGALGISAGEFSRDVVERHLKRDDTRAILEAIETLSKRQQELVRALDEALSGLEDELSGLRQDFDRALRAP